MFKINDEVTIGTNLTVWTIVAIDNDIAWLRQKDTNNNSLKAISDLRKSKTIFENFMSFLAIYPPSTEIGLTFKDSGTTYKRIFKSIEYKYGKPVISVYANGRNSFTNDGKEEEIDASYLTNFELINKKSSM